MSEIAARYQSFLLEIERRGLDGFIVTHPANLRYLFAFTGSQGAALCLDGESRLFIDSRYLEQATGQALNCTPSPAVPSAQKALQDALRRIFKRKPARIGFEATHVSFAFARGLMAEGATEGLEPVSDLVEQIRQIKTAAEIETLEQACRIGLEAYARTLRLIVEGMSEVECAGLLELEMRRLGAERAAFETIVASGPRSSLPHGVAGRRRIQKDEAVLMDFGVRYRGYHSDATRIHVFPGTGLPEIYSIVADAQEAAIEAVRPGVMSTEIDQAARGIIESRGYADFFGHSTGHGLGLEVHELPRIAPRQPAEILEGMVFTIEPGIYLPGRFGVRIEDVVVVTSTGCRKLPAAESAG